MDVNDLPYWIQISLPSSIVLSLFRKESIIGKATDLFIRLPSLPRSYPCSELDVCNSSHLFLFLYTYIRLSYPQILIFGLL